MLRIIVATIMDRACAWTGHELLLCYNRSDWLGRLWFWALDIEHAIPFAPDPEP